MPLLTYKLQVIALNHAFLNCAITLSALKQDYRASSDARPASYVGKQISQNWFQLKCRVKLRGNIMRWLMDKFKANPHLCVISFTVWEIKSEVFVKNGYSCHHNIQIKLEWQCMVKVNMVGKRFHLHTLQNHENVSLPGTMKPGPYVVMENGSHDRSFRSLC